ncbi:hypothetical protein PF006_g27479 [Phytophthora fragariae]|uniref:FYVE-type domain-containing protein n=1 Tax=Phytophthora fragariae TaxID=53985 RepID=A0A6A3QN17_9STRA|nr:hypothetical protein PF006_g27479 [Phytophthora fragariae]
MERHQRETSGRPYIYNDEDQALKVKDSISTSTHSSSGSFALADDYVLSKVKPRHVPLVVAVGVIAGTVEDVAFGGFANTKYSWVVRNSVLKLAHNVAHCFGFVECSNLKKLSWLVSLRRRSEAERALSPGECGVCKKSFKKIGFLQSPSGCAICRRVTCNKCSVQKKLTVDASTKDVVQKNFTFCLSCVIDAHGLSAWEVATSSLQSP